MIVVATKYISENATGDSPAFEFANIGQELLVIETIPDDEKCDYRKEYKYVCQDLNKRYSGFYVRADEVTMKRDK